MKTISLLLVVTYFFVACKKRENKSDLAASSMTKGDLVEIGWERTKHLSYNPHTSSLLATLCVISEKEDAPGEAGKEVCNKRLLILTISLEKFLMDEFYSSDRSIQSGYHTGSKELAKGLTGKYEYSMSSLRNKPFEKLISRSDHHMTRVQIASDIMPKMFLKAFDRAWKNGKKPKL